VAAGGGTEHGASRAVLVYNLCRLGLLALCLGLGWIAGLRSILLLVAALLVSGILSWFVLRPQRIAMGVAVERTVARSQVRFAAKAAAEDSYVDSILGPPPGAAAASPPEQAGESTGPESSASSSGDQPAS
jgi:hypothetical protein